MIKMDKPIILSCHAQEQAHYRGSNEQEIRDAINTAPWQKAELGRVECLKEFAYNKGWNGKHYEKKQVRPIFVEETDKIVVVTVYVYYS